MVDLPDANVWLALSDADHVHYRRALRYWNEESEPKVVFCRLTALALLRLSTNRHALSERPFSPTQAWSNYRRFLDMPNVGLLPEPQGLESQMAIWSETDQFSNSCWTDCAIASWAKLAGCRVVSFDKDFDSFAGLDHIQVT